MKHYLYYVSMKYKRSGSNKWNYVQTHIIATKENVEKSIKMIIRNCIDNDPSNKFKDYKYLKIKKHRIKRLRVVFKMKIFYVVQTGLKYFIFQSLYCYTT